MFAGSIPVRRLLLVIPPSGSNPLTARENIRRPSRVCQPLLKKQSRLTGKDERHLAVRSRYISRLPMNPATTSHIWW